MFCNEQVTSQNPYAEVFVGEPFVQTVDIENIDEVEEALRKILNSSVSSYLHSSKGKRIPSHQEFFSHVYQPRPLSSPASLNLSADWPGDEAAICLVVLR